MQVMQSRMGNIFQSSMVSSANAQIDTEVMQMCRNVDMAKSSIHDPGSGSTSAVVVANLAAPVAMASSKLVPA